MEWSEGSCERKSRWRTYIVYNGKWRLVELKNIYIRCARMWIELEESPVRHEWFPRVTLFRGSIELQWKGVRAHSYFEFRSFGCCIAAVSIHPHCAVTSPWWDTQPVVHSSRGKFFLHSKKRCIMHNLWHFYIWLYGF